jgi:hypothetical protein
MRKQAKLDYAFLALYALTLILAKIDVLPGLFHFIMAILIAFYFFISKMLLEDDFKPRILISISGYVISTSLCLLSLQVFLDNRIDYLTVITGIFGLANLLVAFYYLPKKHIHLGWLHLLTHAIMGFLFF